MWVFDRDSLKFLEVNRAAIQHYGYSDEEFLSMTLRDIRSPEDFTPSSEFFPRLFPNARFIQAGAWKHRKKDGTLIDVIESAHFFTVRGARACLSIVTDVTESKRAEEALRQLSRRLLKSRDEERRRIARELHDSTAQTLATIEINLNRLAKFGGRLNERARLALAESMALTEQASREIRTLSYLLHPPLIDELGLVFALRSYLDGFTRRSGIRVYLEAPPTFPRLREEMELVLFRLVQESLSNTWRHSGSSVATIVLHQSSKNVTLEIKDQGSGIPQEHFDKITGDLKRVGVGIAGMRERADQLGGRLEIESDSHGTTVRAILPLASGDAQK